MREARPLDDALRRIVVDIDALELREELVAVAHARAEPARRLRACASARCIRFSLSGWVLAHSGRLAVGRGPGPAPAARSRGSARRALRARRPDHSPPRSGSACQRVGLIFLVAREAERRSAAAACSRICEIMPPKTLLPSTAPRTWPSTPMRVAAGILLARLGVVGGDMRRSHGRARTPAATSSSISAISWRVM